MMNAVRNTKGGMSMGIIAVLGMVGVLMAGAVSLYGYANSTRTEMIGLETGLAAEYQDGQNYLSTHVASFYEQIGVANLKSEKATAFLTAAMKGKFGDSGFSSNGTFISALGEAFPGTEGFNVYDKVIDWITVSREGYRQKQSKFLDMTRSYDLWRADGIVRSFMVKHVFGAPTEHLRAQIGTEVLTGQKALDQMYVIVLAKDAKEAYKTGEMEPIRVDKEKK